MARRGNKPGLIPWAVTILAAMLLLGQVGLFDWLGQGARTITFSVTSTVASVWDSVSDLVHSHLATARSEKERARLERENQNLKAVLFFNQKIYEENKALRDLIHFHGRYPVTAVAAAKIIYDISRTGIHTAWVDLPKSLRNGASRTKPVISATTSRGVAGRIAEIEGSWGKLLKLSDSGNVIDLVFDGISFHAVGLGTGDDEFIELSFLPHGSGVTAGTLAMSGGLDGFYPAGLPVGTVSAIETPTTGLYDVATIKLAQPSDTLDYVWLMHGRKPDSIFDLAAVDQPTASQEPVSGTSE